VLGAAGTITAALRRKYFPLFAGLWAFGLIAAYSLIPYKTPWLTLNFLVPLALVSGYAVAQGYTLLRSRNRTASLVWVGLVVVAMAVSSYQAWQLNFYRYDDDRNPYVYAQTRRGFLDLVSKINAVATDSGTGLQTSIAVMSPDYWPLPWYLRDYSRTGYFGRVIQDPRTDIVIASAPQALQLKPLLGADYERVGEYPLRPGVSLVAFVRTPASTIK
jgi:predicted membrane-bound mannosyltransferase